MSCHLILFIGAPTPTIGHKVDKIEKSRSAIMKFPLQFAALFEPAFVFSFTKLLDSSYT